MATSINTTSVWSNYSSSNASTQTNNELGKDAFLKLMITQMQNQDPLSPMDNKDMIAQMAQFTSVEQLVNISSQLSAMSQSLGNNSGLIGKVVSWLGETKTGNYDISTGTSEVITTYESGLVDSIIVRNGVHYVKVGSKEIQISDIQQVEDAPEENAGVVEDLSGSGQGE
ncbi:flagellar hook assembly protein FlgD [Paenibacillus brevis]|uniref:Flagellar hook capping protein n=1 Tax=Paenibacillus brevis TaxID=2841508 RepID=A0ABS6FT16_9BACL|nr:flagellar hook capping FlgD N-terminal domain-containing protein [Paenibacillus brevis]MBU5673076.1 flagellar hook capping protein [Paenibacillus brevis]